jgi:T3SS (YopN, CesT) and YbjN peptide-binding chaperone 1/T3SS (YopN, CesT) and YbjN peptide-binding chaperone 3
MQVEEPRDQELVLQDEPTTADLRSKVTDAWREFARALGALLPTLAAGAILELTLDPTASGTGDAVYSVAVQAAGEGELVALAVGNASLPAGYRMDRAAVADLVALGWSPPGVVPGSGDSFGLRTTTGQAGQLATVVARTLRDVYGAPHPAFLVYFVHDEENGPLPVEPLGTARPDASLVAPGPPAAGPPLATGNGDIEDVTLLAEQVRTVVAALLRSDPEQLQLDSDGDISIRAGSAMVFVRVRDNPLLVDVISPVLTEVKPTEKLYAKLSELTNRMPIGRLYCANETVWASVPVFGRKFQAIHLMLAIQVMTGLADELDDRLHGEFGGRRFFSEDDLPVPKGPDQAERTGMYL